MYFIIYKTTNKINGKFYIGKHQTQNLDDGYIGSGKLLTLAIKKYGYSNFNREILHYCSSIEELNSIESSLVTEELISDQNCYNIKLGGQGGFDYHNRDSEKQKQKNLLSQKKQKELMSNPEWVQNKSLAIKASLRKSDSFREANTKRKTITDQELLCLLEKNKECKSPVRETMRQLGRGETGGLSRRARKLLKEN